MDRAEALQQLRGTARPWDVLVIGGGASGLGTAVDAAARGYRTLLLEQDDFAKGTSSRSTKLIHGGVRYLRQGNVSLVLEALHERGRLLRNAPHLVHHLSFLVPAYDWWEGPFYGAGLKLYDLLAGKLGIEASSLLSRAQTLERLPTLRAEGLRGGVEYYDGQFDDARLAMTLAATLFDLHGVALNRFPVVSLLKSRGQVAGVRARDGETGAEHEIEARVVINATGVFGDGVRRLDEPGAAALIAPSQGAHLVLDRSFLPARSAIMVPHTDDGRVLFAVPWHHRVVVGTTDLVVPEPSVEPRATPEEIEFLLAHAARYLTRAPRREDVQSCFAGLRPLMAAGPDTPSGMLSRDHSVIVSPSGMVSVMGGKWTTYRRMAQDTVDHAAQVAGLDERACVTPSLKLHGWTETPDPEPWGVYGSDAAFLRALAAERPALGAPLHARLPYVGAQVVWAVRREMARTVEDVLARRTAALFLDARASMEMAPEVARLMAAELGRDAAWEADQREAFLALARGYLP